MKRRPPPYVPTDDEVKLYYARGRAVQRGTTAYGEIGRWVRRVEARAAAKVLEQLAEDIPPGAGATGCALVALLRDRAAELLRDAP